MKIIKEQLHKYSLKTVRRPHESFLPVQDLKVGIELEDGNVIEAAVFTILKDEKLEKHACISTQVGCRFSCKFCTSGKNGFFRNLSEEEIYEEIFLLLKEEGVKQFEDIMFMGIGEPLDNFDNVSKSIQKIKSENLSSKRISLATIGIPDKIEQLSNLNIPVKLWLSLHAINDKKRSEIIPANKIYPIKDIINSAKKYAQKSKMPVILNYLLFKKFNDCDEDIIQLVNTLPLNKKENCFQLMLTEPNSNLLNYEKASYKDLIDFKDRLLMKCPDANIKLFLSKGKEVNAGCGQFSFSPKKLTT